MVAIRSVRLAMGLISVAIMLAPGSAEARYHAAAPAYDRAGSDSYGREPGWRNRGAADPRRDDRPGRGYRCDRGTGGTIIGAIAGGLLGNGVAGRGDRTIGTMVGAGAGALAGRAIDRDC